MPYIDRTLRDYFDDPIDALLDELCDVPKQELKGVLNYVISRIVSGAIHRNGGAPWKYNEIADAVATFECAKLEFYRRIAVPKEDHAIQENGDIVEYNW